MCGICGILRWDGEPVEGALVRAMADRMIHRGPDGEGIFLWPEAEDTSSLFAARAPTSNVSVGLGNRRLAVIDPQGGRQPVSNEEGTVTAVYNGEIYNFRELRTALQSQGHRFRSRTDTEVIVHQYEQDGWRCVERFRGMFAFALWDTPNRTLLLARDRIGIKPLYYTLQGQRLLFASELWSLLCGLGRVPAVDPVALAQLFTVQYTPAPRTLFPNIMKLPAGHAALWHDEKLELIRYWRPGRLDEEPSAGWSETADEAELVQALRRRLDDAVAAHLVSDVPLGAFLSGGLDSSLIVASMQRIRREPIKTFAVGFEGPPDADELDAARTAASAIGTDHHEVVVTPRSFLEAMPQAVAALDDPVLDPAIVPTLLVSRLARQEVTVVLTGEGGDELFGGYQRYRLQRWTRLIRMIPHPLRPLMLKRIRSRRLGQALEAYWADSPAARHLGWVATGPLSDVGQLCGEAVHFQEAVRLVLEQFERLSAEAPVPRMGAPDAMVRMLDLDVRTWLPDDLLVKVDRMTMAVSLEARVPYLDHPLVEWAARLPARMKIRRGIGKYLLKRAAAGRLPEAIVRRPKRGFEPPLSRWLRGPMGETAREQVESSAIYASGVWNRHTVDRWFGAHRRGEADYSLLLWGVWSFALWYDRVSVQGRGGGAA
ncbi:MAG: asparagine synthase (glutamine-hydrolyzing) [Nitrospirota bacterium]